MRAYCEAKPGALERRRWRETMFTVQGRVFAFMNSPASAAVTVKVARGERRTVLMNASVAKARYVGCFGWITASVHDDETLWLAFELIDRSYALVAARAR